MLTVQGYSFFSDHMQTDIYKEAADFWPHFQYSSLHCLIFQNLNLFTLQRQSTKHQQNLFNPQKSYKHRIPDYMANSKIFN